MGETIIEYDNKLYTVTNELPKTGDQVLTDGYGVWVFHEGSAPLPYWCNPKSCKKILSVKDC